MNNVLQAGYDQLRQEERRSLRQRLADSPRAIRMLDFLEERKGRKFNTVDVVANVYHDEADEDFPTLRNRFFKLRKHILSLLDQNPSGSAGGVTLLPLEEELYRCRQLIAGNHFNQVRKQLKELISECRKLNIFELLPEALNLLVYANLALNNFREHDRTLRDLEESSKLLDDLRSMQVLSRRIYLAAISRDTDTVVKHLQSMRRVVLRREGFPRFELFYQFTVVNNAASVPGYSSKGHARHLSALKSLTAKYPGMPAGSYEPHGASLMQYYILVADGTHHFMRGDVHTCYNLFKEAWDIQERVPNLKIRKSESNFKNKMAIEVATGRLREAVKTAHELIEFHKEHKQEEKRMNGYAELAIVYTYGFPGLQCPDPDFLLRQLKAYSALMKRAKSSSYGEALSTEAIFAFMNRDWKTAKKIALLEPSRKVFSSMKLDVYNDILLMSPATSREVIAETRKKLRAQLDKAVSADLVFTLRRALNMLASLEA